MAIKGAGTMYQAAVIYAPSSQEMNALSKLIVGKLPQDRIKAVRKEASQASIPDLASADLVLLGSTAEGTAAVHQGFAEILRALGGISLAGRTVGVFALRTESTLKAFKKALQDCETTIGPGHYLMLSTAEAAEAALGPWLNSLIEHLEARRNER
jgi:flavodoxin